MSKTAARGPRPPLALDPELIAAASADAAAADAPVLIACSGGGDSIALLHLCARALGPERLHIVTINHNLRAEAAAEIALAARHGAQLGVAHQVLDWHWDGQGNLQAAARAGRRALLTEAADRIGAKAILLGHTRDDQAETVLMRLARGSGVEGLAGMARRQGLFHRPLLDCTRAELRDWLRGQGLNWAEDPSNTDPQFDRVRARQMAEALADLGLTQERIVQTADLMQGEAAALRFALRDWAGSAVRARGGGLEMDLAGFEALPETLQTRCLGQIVRWFSGASYKPRREALLIWANRLQEGQGWAPLGGVMARQTAQGMLVFEREFNAVEAARDLTHGPETQWDHRWHVTGPYQSGLTIGALGPDLEQIENWRDQGLPRQGLETTPAIRKKQHLIAAPGAGHENGWTATLRPSFAEFLDTH